MGCWEAIKQLIASMILLVLNSITCNSEQSLLYVVCDSNINNIHDIHNVI